MQLKCSTWGRSVSGMAALTLVAAFALGALASSQPAKNGPHKPLPKEIVEAWKKAGAEVVWLRVNKSGDLILDIDTLSGDLPAFRFPPPKRLPEKMPSPPTAFGVVLGGTKVTDEELKQLAGLQNLQTLHLSFTPVTDAGLKHLGGLKNLQSLYLEDTKVTDAGLKELGGLKTLKLLDLKSTSVTDAGVKELQKALPNCKVSR